MNWSDEAKEIIKCSIQDDSEQAVKAIIMSIIEFSELPGMNIQDLRQFMHDIYHEIDCPEDEDEVEDDICECYSGGVLDS